MKIAVGMLAMVGALVAPQSAAAEMCPGVTQGANIEESYIRRAVEILRELDGGDEAAIAEMIAPAVTSAVEWSGDNVGGGTGISGLRQIARTINSVRFKGFIPVRGAVTVDTGEICRRTVEVAFAYGIGKVEEPRETRLFFTFERGLLINLTGQTYWTVSD